MAGGSTAFYSTYLERTARRWPATPVAVPALRILSGGGGAEAAGDPLEVKREMGVVGAYRATG